MVRCLKEKNLGFMLICLMRMKFLPIQMMYRKNTLKRVFYSQSPQLRES